MSGQRGKLTLAGGIPWVINPFTVARHCSKVKAVGEQPGRISATEVGRVRQKKLRFVILGERWEPAPHYNGCPRLRGLPVGSDVRGRPESWTPGGKGQFLYLALQKIVSEQIAASVEAEFGLRIPAPFLDAPPNLEMGDLSCAACFELAKKLRQAPRKIAEQLAAKFPPLKGVVRVSTAGAGYVNFFLDRGRLAQGVFQQRISPTSATPATPGKILVEHTSINPNKAAHIGHLRNAILGDTFVRVLRSRGNRVEVQNYIDNTGVQVADVVVGFAHLEKKSLQDVERLIQDPAVRFDFYCWDLYARVFQHCAEKQDALAWRAEALKAIEEGHGEIAAIAELVSATIVRAHLTTMLRVNIRYDLLARESEILRLNFWAHAFDLMKRSGAIRYADSGKNTGCWVMALGEDGGEPAGDESEDEKIIVRSNGTVTYVGKDIAYHLWKFGLLGRDFGYKLFHRYEDGQPVWSTTVAGESNTPPFGAADVAYAVIDTRQSYLQNVVAAAFRALGYGNQAQNLHHFAYEVVGLTPRCAAELGVDVGQEDRDYIEVSGRKGLGIKADDLIDRLVQKALDGSPQPRDDHGRRGAGILRANDCRRRTALFSAQVFAPRHHRVRFQGCASF